MANRLTNKVCVITGTGSGIGRAGAELFAREGAQVVGCDINAERGRATAAAVCAAGGQMVSLDPCDMTREQDAEALMALAEKTFGRVNVVWNNGAMAYFDWVESMTFETWYKTIDQELNIVFRGVKAAWPRLKAAGGGSLINTASIQGMQAVRDSPGLAHSAAKGGVLAMTKQLAMEGAGINIRANCVAPGLVITAQTEPLLQKHAAFSESLAKMTMLPRFGQPIDIAYCALYLASDESSWVTGTSIVVDGGLTAW
jgi:NAD(P)-dependent dehydrogenase (short-subunit alcohol dehydrogenase family)